MGIAALLHFNVAMGVTNVICHHHHLNAKCFPKTLRSIRSSNSRETHLEPLGSIFSWRQLSLTLSLNMNTLWTLLLTHLMGLMMVQMNEDMAAQSLEKFYDVFGRPESHMNLKEWIRNVSNIIFHIFIIGLDSHIPGQVQWMLHLYRQFKVHSMPHKTESGSTK